MDNNYLAPYVPLLIHVLLAMVLAGALVFLSWAVGNRKPSRAKMQAYECGIRPTGDAREPFSVKFYLVAMLFILFDIEVVFLYPWAAIYRTMLQENPTLILCSMLSFLGILFVGYIYALKKGAFDWKS